MSQLNDCKLAALIAGGYGDQLNDAMLAWAQANGATSNQLNEAMLEAAANTLRAELSPFG